MNKQGANDKKDQKTGASEQFEAFLTEFEENVRFDSDDPDFASTNDTDSLKNKLNAQLNELLAEKCAEKESEMSAASVQKSNSENLSRTESSISLPSYDVFQDSHPQYQDSIVTIEELKIQLNSCFSCGVSWIQKHVSLDCKECGGYPLTRPCPLCDGRCHTEWKRDLSSSHTSGKARWIGECPLTSCSYLEESLVFI